MSSPAATSSTLRPPSRACTTALPGLQGPSGIPEVPISGMPSPPSSPPLAALTASNELALQPKPSKSNRANSASHASRSRRRGGATLQIREECERFFCETMKAVFQGERDMAGSVSGLTGVYSSVLTPPPDDYPTPPSSFSSTYSGRYVAPPVAAMGWMEFWDYAGGTSFRAFVAEEDNGDKSLFAFFDSGLVNDRRDLKQALIALIELADVPMGCSRLVVCLDRVIPEQDNKTLMRNLQWAGFELTTLDHWAKAIDVTSDKWLFMEMEI
ncbi:ornithine decarboxylase antizyme-domain-containing protein [Microdochium trichocladiopsis]|uniref:Ornithine decarboxylase antizyme n=1 Tax=Microdochium trichocladiopsis TaxID=1682393 RepID=A0A9P9BR04_9PEZI|nr:ornithine decarboxylase antizyme-domain-containing protein [Microdochium trichocladiopsis]KAH7026427.1 ornithine decarboxylase antizyme-domain-containing protein [Microdochium trichocladiopsis]